jgi:carboxypeptidase family protein
MWMQDHVLGCYAALLITGGLIASGGCNKTQSPVQSTPVPSPTVSRFSVAGSVDDTALRPLADVKIAVLDGPGAGTSTLTDAAGSFALAGEFSDPVTVLASKDGYRSVTTRYPPPPQVGRVSIYLELSTPQADITGEYTATFTASRSCSSLPDAARQRTYNLSISKMNTQPIPIPDQYTMTFSGATFVIASGFPIRVAGADARVFFGSGGSPDGQYFFSDPWGDGYTLAEEIAPSTYLGFWGEPTLTIAGSTISGSFFGGFAYCASPTTVAPGAQHCPVQPVICWATDHHVTFVKH